MHTLFPEKYYRQHWKDFLDRKICDVPSLYMNMESELDSDTKDMTEALKERPDGGTQAVSGVRCIMAQRIFTKRYKDLIKTREKIRDIEAGRYPVAHSRISAVAYRKRWEFNCLQLHDFMMKYGCYKD